MNERVPVVFEDYYEPLNLWTNVSVYPQPDGGLAVFFRRTNEEKRIQQQLLQSKEEAERANHLKSAFLANMSHEIRTPLGAMMGFADLLRDPNLSESERTHYTDILHKNGEQLGRLINDVLDLSKVETGFLKLEYLPIRPAKIAKEVLSLMSVLAQEKGLSLSYDEDGTAPDEIVTDPTRMKQVLLNLVSNSVKFTKAGSVRITLSGHLSPQGKRCCAFNVLDTGVGIPPEAVEKLFRVFTQADNSITRKFGGTGLGLALSKSIARVMGGDVELLQSHSEKGSLFRFTIESREEFISASSNETPATLSNISRKPKLGLAKFNILVVEDSLDNQHLIRAYLTRAGAEVEIAPNGLEGFERALKKEYDAILMDLQMPVMDGYTATGKLRAAGYTKPILALTAHAMSDVRDRCREIGFDDHLPKPINPTALVRAIQEIVSKET